MLVNTKHPVRHPPRSVVAKVKAVMAITLVRPNPAPRVRNKGVLNCCGAKVVLGGGSGDRAVCSIFALR